MHDSSQEQSSKNVVVLIQRSFRPNYEPIIIHCSSKIARKKFLLFEFQPRYHGSFKVAKLEHTLETIQVNNTDGQSNLWMLLKTYFTACGLKTYFEVSIHEGM